MSGIKRELPNNEYEAAINAASPSAGNPFVTFSSLPASSNLGSADLISSATSRKFDISGNTISQDLSIRTLSGSDIMKLRGDLSVILPGGYMGINISTVGPSYGGHRFTIVNDSNSNGVYVQQTGGNGKAILVTLTATAGSNVWGYHCSSSNVTAVTKIGALLDITGSSSANIAIDFVNGDCKFGTGTGSMLGTATNQKIGAFNTTPIVQPTALTAAVATPTDGTIGTNDTITDNLRVRVDELEAKFSTAGGGLGWIA